MSLHKSNHCDPTFPCSLLPNKESNLCLPHKKHRGFKIEKPTAWSVVYDKTCLQSVENHIETEIGELCPVKVLGFFVGSISYEPGGLKLSVKLDKFDPGTRNKNGILCPTNNSKNAVICPLFKLNNLLLGSDHAPYLSMVDEIMKYKKIYDQMKFHNRNGTNLLLEPRFCTLYCKTAKDNSFVKFITLATTSKCSFFLLPIESTPIIHTALVKSFTSVCESRQRPILSGFLTKDQNGSLMLLLDTDPKIYQLPIVGIWLEGIENIHHPLIWLTCLRYINSQLFLQRGPDESFLLVIYTEAQPSYHHCTCSSFVSEFSYFSSECHIVNNDSGDALQMNIGMVSENCSILDLIVSLTQSVGQLCLNLEVIQNKGIFSHKHDAQNKSEKQYLLPSVPEPSLLLQETIQTCKKISSSSDELATSNVLLPISFDVTSASEKTHLQDCNYDIFLPTNNSVQNGLSYPNTGIHSEFNAKETVTCGTQTDFVPVIEENKQSKECTRLSNFSNESTNQENEFNSCPSICTTVNDSKSCALSLSLGASASTCKKPAQEDNTTTDEFLVETLNQLNAVLSKPNQQQDIEVTSRNSTTIKENTCDRLESSTPELNFVSFLNEKGLLHDKEVDSLIHSQNESELSMHANAIALKYLTDDRFPEFKDILRQPKHLLCQPKSNSDGFDPNANSISPSNVSLATQKYLQKYGLTNLTIFGQKEDTDEVMQPSRNMMRQPANAAKQGFLPLDDFHKDNVKTKPLKNEDACEEPWTRSDEECLSDDLEKSVGDTVKEILHPKMLQTLNRFEFQNNWITNRSRKSMDGIQKQTSDNVVNLSSNSEVISRDHRRSNSTGRILSSQFLHLLAEKQTRRMSSSPKSARKNFTGEAH
uniref:SCL-interrupting locus protein homolog n=1 Tax=Phallusia mammillata TaxID=59560 RepID=A0A6F9DUF7_9ASCI|nr:SCL-interrupting locus protein homolog [Phallusia mammillata]